MGRPPYILMDRIVKGRLTRLPNPWRNVYYLLSARYTVPAIHALYVADNIPEIQKYLVREDQAPRYINKGYAEDLYVGKTLETRVRSLRFDYCDYRQYRITKIVMIYREHTTGGRKRGFTIKDNYIFDQSHHGSALIARNLGIKHTNGNVEKEEDWIWQILKTMVL